jgi:hypothetical protein
MFKEKVLSLASCALDCPFHESPIFRMDTLKDGLDRGGTFLIVAKKSETLV